MKTDNPEMAQLAEEEKRILRDMLNEAFANDFRKDIEKQFADIREALCKLIETERKDISSNISKKLNEVIQANGKNTAVFIDEIKQATDKTKNLLTKVIYINIRTELNSTRRNGIKRYFYNDVPVLLKHAGIMLNLKNLEEIWDKAEFKSKKYGFIKSYEILRRNVVAELDAYFANIDKTCHDKGISQSEDKESDM